MTPEEKAQFDNLYTLVRENNNILRNIQRRGRISFALRIFYWVLIIGLSLGAFYFIQPYVDMIRGLTGDGANNSTYSQQLKELLE